MVDECGVILAGHLEIITVREPPTEDRSDSLNAYAFQEANSFLDRVDCVACHALTSFVIFVENRRTEVDFSHAFTFCSISSVTACSKVLLDGVISLNFSQS